MPLCFCCSNGNVSDGDDGNVSDDDGGEDAVAIKDELHPHGSVSTHELSRWSSYGLRKVIVEPSSYDVRTYADVTFCPCDNQSCATNSAILGLGAMTADGQLNALVQEVKSNGLATVLELPDGGRLTDVAREKVNDPSNKGLNEAEILSILIYTGTKIQRKFRRHMIDGAAKYALALPAWPNLCALL